MSRHFIGNASKLLPALPKAISDPLGVTPKLFRSNFEANPCFVGFRHSLGIANYQKKVTSKMGGRSTMINPTCCWKSGSVPKVHSAELKWPRLLLRILPNIVDLGPNSAPKPAEAKPKMSGAVPTNWYTSIPIDIGRVSGRLDHDSKLLNCEIAQPSQVGMTCRARGRSGSGFVWLSSRPENPVNFVRIKSDMSSRPNIQWEVSRAPDSIPTECSAGYSLFT